MTTGYMTPNKTRLSGAAFCLLLSFDFLLLSEAVFRLLSEPAIHNLQVHAVLGGAYLGGGHRLLLAYGRHGGR